MEDLGSPENDFIGYARYNPLKTVIFASKPFKVEKFISKQSIFSKIKSLFKKDDDYNRNCGNYLK